MGVVVIDGMLVMGGLVAINEERLDAGAFEEDVVGEADWKSSKSSSSAPPG